MGIKADLPRLNKIDGAALAKHVEDLVEQHIGRLAFQLGSVVGPKGPSQIGLTVQLLLEYARTGTDCEAETPAIAAEYARDRVAEICAALYSQAGRPGTFETPDLGGESDHGEPTTEIGVVLLAAWTRQQITDGEKTIPIAGVAALSSIGTSYLRQRIDSGDLRRSEKGELETQCAVVWMEARGVDGLRQFNRI